MSHYQPTQRSSSSSSRTASPDPRQRGDVVRRSSSVPRPDPYGLDLQEEPELPSRSSVRRYQAAPPVVAGRPAEVNVVIHRRASRVRQTEPVPVVQDDDDVPVPRSSFWRHVHPLVSVGGAMCLTLLLVIVGQALVNKWQVTQDDWTYGYPRLAQVDARVGHDDAQRPTHFMALNLNGQIFLFECPSSDCTKAKVYPGPVLLGAHVDLAAATITVKDVNGDGKPDLVLRVQDSLFVLINDNGSFRPKRADEQVNV